MGRPRKQDGWLRAESGSWLGTWRVYRGTNKSARRTVNIGRESDLTEEQAKQKLRAIIDRDTEQFEAVRFLSATTKPIQKRTPRSKPIHGLTVGAVSEYLVVIDLMERGLYVYRATSPSAVCDLMVCDFNGDFRLRVEVKTAQGGKDRKPFVDVTRNAGKFDILAVVNADGSIIYSTHNGIGLPKVFLNDPDSQLTHFEVTNVN